MVTSIRFWQWLGRLAPMVTLLGLCLTLWLGPDTWADYLIIAIAVSFGLIAFAWWWWVIIAVKDLTDMLKKNQEDFIKVIEEISILRKDMSKSRKPRVAHNDPDKDLNKPKD